jgi:autotransporter-associated beta strand protein/T5SS/PEP-CTERM-associated repeat protein
MRLCLALLALSAAIAMTVDPAHAQTSNWTGATSNLYGASGNWDNNTPPTNNTETANFGGGGANTNVNVAAPVTINDLSFQGSTNYSLTGSAITLSGAGPPALSNASGAAISIANVINGSDAFIRQSGNGTLTLTGTGSSIGADLDITAGKVAVNTGSLTVGGDIFVVGGTLAVTGGGTLNNQNAIISQLQPTASQVLVTGAGSNWNIASSLMMGGFGGIGGAGTLTIADGATVTVTSPNVATIASGSTLNLGTGGLAGSISVTQIQNDGRIIANFTDTSTLAANIVDSAGGATIIKQGTGTLILSGTNGYGTVGTVATTVEGGTLRITNISGLGAGDASFQNGTTLQLDGSIGNISNNIFVAGSVKFDVESGIAGIGFAGQPNGVIADGTSSGSIVKTGAGTLELDGTNTYTGSTTVSAGTLLIGSDLALPTSTDVAVNSGATLEINGGFFTQIRSLSGAGSVVIDSELDIGDAVGHGSSTVFSGVISGNGSLLIDHAGLLTLTGTGSSIGGDLTICSCVTGGLTISGGSFTARDFISVEGGTLTVSNGGRLRQSGALEAMIVGSDISGVNAAVLVTGAGSMLTVGGTLYVGVDPFFGPLAGGSSLTIAAGGEVTSNHGANIGTDPTAGSAMVLVTGAGSVLNVAGGLSVGPSAGLGGGTGVLVVADGGLVNVTSGTAIVRADSTLVLGIGGLAGILQAPSLTLNGKLIADFTDTLTLGFSITGTGGSITKQGSGTLVLGGNNTYSGGTFLDGGTLRLTGAGKLGAATGTTTIAGGTLDLGGTTQTQAAVNLTGGAVQNGALNAPITSAGGIITAIGGTASITTTAGFTAIAGNNSYTGATIVNGGTLQVDGTISGTSGVTVNSGGFLTGGGTIDPLVVTINSGATFMPGSPGVSGSSTTIVGNLALQSGALYLIQLGAAGSTFANVTGTAMVNGTAQAVFLPNFLAQRSTILTAAGGVQGTFGGLVNTNLPSSVTDSLSYDTNHVYLDLALNFAALGGLNANQQQVANALTNFFNTTGGIPGAFAALTPAGLTQASGEVATASQQTTFDAMNLFMGLLTDPFVAGRSDSVTESAGAPPFADEGSGVSAYGSKGRPQSKSERDAYAAIARKAPPPPSFEQRWSVWAAGYGGSQTTNGNPVVGSNTATSSIYGTAVGADYRFSPFTMAGFALAGGGTNFSIGNALGIGRSDLFQAGAYVRHTVGPAYVTAALAYGWQDITTNRTVAAAGSDQLRAEFNANTFSGRLEGGYRLITPWAGGIGITPYAAAQFTTFDLPAYAEQVLAGAGTFALAYGAKDVTDTRSELGVRADKSYALSDGIFTLRGRLAWAHDFNPDRSIAATFQALPGASFVVNGAAQAQEAALTTASAEMKWINGWSAAVTFEGEFSDVTRSYAGKGVLRYHW